MQSNWPIRSRADRSASTVQAWTLFTLAAGDCPVTIYRCLTSILRRLDVASIRSIRVGLVDPTAATVKAVLDVHAMSSRVVDWVIENNQGDGTGDAMMRRLFRLGLEVATPSIMWFDHDSYVRPGDDLIGLAGRALADGHDLVAARDRDGDRGSALYVRPAWNAHYPEDEAATVPCGWWATRYRTLLRIGYPANRGPTGPAAMLAAFGPLRRRIYWVNSQIIGKSSCTQASS